MLRLISRVQASVTDHQSLGADHLTLEGGMGDFWSASFFFPRNLVGRIFFSLLNALQDIFFSHFSAGFFFPQKSVVLTSFTECIYIYIVVIAVMTSNSSNVELQSLKML